MLAQLVGELHNQDAVLGDQPHQRDQANLRTEDERYPIEKRIATIKGSIAVISVGAATQTELREKMDRVDDAVRATKAAIAEGFVAGGGTAFLIISLFSNRVTFGFVIPTQEKSKDFKLGWKLVFDSLKTPIGQICANAGVESTPITSNLIKFYSTASIERLKNKTMGYNVLTEKIEDMVEAGIIDSTKALRCALTNAVSVAGMVLTSECSIISVY